MNVVIAVDKFKNSLTTFEAGNAIRNGFLLADPRCHITVLPLADGGDGLLDVIAYYTKAKKKPAAVVDPLFRPITASYLLAADEQTAIIEMATASGIQLLQPKEYDCRITSSYGTGQLIKEAIQSGATKVIIGIGGSATNDGGIGMAAALGYRFIDKNGNELLPVGENLIHIAHIDTSKKIPIDKVAFEIACDVTNYLTGAQGATNVYAPQKGASPETVLLLEEGMQHYATVVKQELGINITTIEGGGAAGGMGAGCVAFLDAKLIKGTELVLQYSHASHYIAQADIVITGEGKIDEQTFQGKVISGITALGKKYHKPVIALCGSLAIDKEQLHQAGISAAFSIINCPMLLEEAYQNAADLLTEVSYYIATLYADLKKL